jgi:YHS domain-containing protein
MALAKIFYLGGSPFKLSKPSTSYEFCGRRFAMDVINSKRITRVLSLIVVAAIIGTWASQASAFEEVNKDFFGVAIKGYDPVAYFTEGAAVKGKSEFSQPWNEAKWYFASETNRDLFAAEPERYAPQYGGY